MKKSKVALVALIAAAIVAAGVSVVGFTATGIGRNDKKSDLADLGRRQGRP